MPHLPVPALFYSNSTVIVSVFGLGLAVLAEQTQGPGTPLDFDRQAVRHAELKDTGNQIMVEALDDCRRR